MYQSRRDDYIERLIKRFFETLERIRGKDTQANNEVLPDARDEMLPLYEEYFDIKRRDVLQPPEEDLPSIVAMLHAHQLRPLALLLYHDAIRQPADGEKYVLLERARWLLEYAHVETGQIDFEDIQVLSHIERELAKRG